MNYYIIIYNLNSAEADTIMLNLRDRFGSANIISQYDCYDRTSYLVSVEILDTNFDYKDWKRNHTAKRKFLISAARAHWSSSLDYYITDNEELANDLRDCLR